MSTQTNGAIQRNIDVVLEGRGSAVLRPADHIATGGEGSVYKPSSKTLVKLYRDKTKMHVENMADKIRLLSKIAHPFIVSPRGLVFEKNKPIGYYMDYVHGEPLARVFTTSYRQREKFTDTHAIELVAGMRTTVIEAHKHGAIMVDANEFNWLIHRSKSVVEPRVIDVDSWSIGTWEPSVIMPSIRDWHSKSFTKETDWFSFAVVSFQVFTGIHPYKGVLSGYKPNDLEKRMKDNASVFTRGVRLNSAVRDFNCIPSVLLNWYEAVFQTGVRTAPPSPHEKKVLTPKKIVTAKTIVTNASDVLTFSMLLDGIHDSPAEVYDCGVVRMTSGTLIQLAGNRTIGHASPPCEVVQVEHEYLIATIKDDGALHCVYTDRSGTQVSLETRMKAHHLMRYRNRLFVVTEKGMVELSVKDFGKPLLVVANTWNALVHSTIWLRGMGVQNTLGTTYLVLPFGDTSCAYVRVPELDGQKIADGVAGTQFVAVTALDQQSGSYYRYDIVFDATYQKYSSTKTLIDSPDLNCAVLQKGSFVTIPDDGTLTIGAPLAHQERTIHSQSVKSSFVLCQWENKVLFIDGAKVWHVSMK